ncbi:MAG: alpha/beta hydrolase [Saprospiraceae bacterium]|nr:alpha/beta hydrolase [Candidatus Vicinibacter affinis]MBK9641990.1 alpha/beta hydrolase [Candidatus Vicinibacter affinis]
MNKHSLHKVFLFLVCLVTGIYSCKSDPPASKPISLSNIFPADSISSYVVKYGEVTFSNPVKIWEIDLDSPPWLSTSYDIFWDLIQRTSEQDLTVKNVLKAKLYRHKDKVKRPLVLLMHGGGYVKGHKDSEEMAKLCRRLAMRGYVAASVEYRMMNILTCSFIKAGYCGTQDAKAALRYFYAHADALNIDKKNIFIGGISAGAINALHAGFLDPSEKIADKTDKLSNMYGGVNESGNEDYEMPVIAGIINIGGGVFSTEILDNKIPLLNVCGEHDDIISPVCDLPFNNEMKTYNEAIAGFIGTFDDARSKKLLKDALMIDMCGGKEIHQFLLHRKSSSELIYLPGYGHQFMFSSNGNFSTKGSEVFEKISAFLFKNYKN